jgi:hypothetical protein
MTLIVFGYLKNLLNKALTNNFFGHFQITLKSSDSEVSSSRNFKIVAGLPFLNNDEKISCPRPLFSESMSNNNKS